MDALPTPRGATSVALCLVTAVPELSWFCLMLYCLDVEAPKQYQSPRGGAGLSQAAEGVNGITSGLGASWGKSLT